MAETKPRPWTPGEERVGSFAVRLMSRANAFVFRLTSGRLGARFTGGAPVFLLITTGRKTGQKRTSPLIYLADGARWIVVASKGGMSHHPLWFGNLEANPRATIDLGREQVEVRARRASVAEKAELWPRMVAIYPDYDDYQARTERDIPVVILERA